MFVVTGIARSGTSYVCQLLNKIEPVYCMHEQMTDFMLSVSDRNDLGRVFYGDRVEPFFVQNMCMSGIDPGSKKCLGLKIPFPDLSINHVMQLPEVSFVAILRHPVDLFLSQDTRDMDKSPWPREVFMRDGGMYKYHIYNNYSNLLENMHPQKVLRLKYEDIVNDPGQLQVIGTFLGLPGPLSPACCAEIVQAVAGFGRKPRGVICPVRGCLENRTGYADNLVAFFTEVAARFCHNAMARFGYGI